LVSPAGIRVAGTQVADNFLWSPEEAVRNLYLDASHVERALAGSKDAAFLERTLRNRQTTARLVWNPRWFNPVLHKWLSRVRLPTFIVWGDQDRLFPAAHAPHFAQLIPGARHRTIEGCGHMPFIEKPAQFHALVDDFFAEACR
jgi:pimeloyl-ACP methyl ester carboxylesterase